MQLGQRVLVWGISCSGKSTLASELAEHFGYSFVELDALNWMPGWVGLHETDPERFAQRMRAATQGERWVVAGSYTAHSRPVFWSRLDTVIWLDLPRPLLILRCLVRCWQRSRRKTLLWGTNRERFINHLKVWNKDDSLFWWVWTRYHPKRKETLRFMVDGSWRDAQIIRLTSPAQVREFKESLGVPIHPPRHTD